MHDANPYTPEQVEARNWIDAVASVLKASIHAPDRVKAGNVLADATYNVEFVNEVMLLASAAGDGE